MPAPNFQTSPSSLELLFFSNARSSSMRLFFFFFGAFLTYFYTMTFTSYLVYLFFFSKCFPLFCFACLTSDFKVVHSSVVCLQLPWYWQTSFLNVLHLNQCPRNLQIWLISFFWTLSWYSIYFLREHLEGLIFLNFQSLSWRNPPWNGLDHLNSCIPVLPFSFSTYLA